MVSGIIIGRNYAGDCLPGLPAKYAAYHVDGEEAVGYGRTWDAAAGDFLAVREVRAMDEPLHCRECVDGRRYESRRQSRHGIDPDIRDAGSCECCGGTQVQSCDACRKPAIIQAADGHVFCLTCHGED